LKNDLAAAQRTGNLRRVWPKLHRVHGVGSEGCQCIRCVPKAAIEPMVVGEVVGTGGVEEEDEMPEAAYRLN